MKILNKKDQQKLLNIVVANQIILNSYNQLEGWDQIEAFSVFCENTSQALFIAGGIEALEQARDYVFQKTQM